MEEQFFQAWAEMSKLINEFEGSLGPRLHNEEEGIYLYYAQWTNRATWENSGNKLSNEAEYFRTQMRDSCIEISTLQTLNIREDLTESSIYSDN